MPNVYAMLKSTLALALLLAMTACTHMGSSRDVANPEILGAVIAAQVCSNCHGLTGESSSPSFPKLAGQRKEYLAAQLVDFKGHDRSDARGTQYMWGFTHLTAKQLDELAEYFSSQPPMRGRVMEAMLVVRGEQIFSNGITENEVLPCVACHGPAAEGNGVIPRLAGQHASYTVEQLNVFKTSDQRPRGTVMKQVTHALSDQDMQAVARYVESIGAAQ